MFVAAFYLAPFFVLLLPGEEGWAIPAFSIITGIVAAFIIRLAHKADMLRLVARFVRPRKGERLIHVRGLPKLHMGSVWLLMMLETMGLALIIGWLVKGVLLAGTYDAGQAAYVMAYSAMALWLAAPLVVLAWIGRPAVGGHTPWAPASYSSDRLEVHELRSLNAKDVITAQRSISTQPSEKARESA